jgi:DNA-binding CsgD family transcriptional regulator
MEPSASPDLWPALTARLSPRECRAAALVATGHRDKEIAYILGLTIPTIIGTLARVRKKAGVRTRTDLAALWCQGASQQRCPPLHVTHAERAIALYVVGGWSNAQIARVRGVSLRCSRRPA